jgi:hypothetical protein
MDGALLRRIPYKLKLEGPSRAEFERLVADEAKSHGLEVPHDVMGYIVESLTESGAPGLAYFQPKFICEQVTEACQAFDIEPCITRDLASEALSNLYVKADESLVLPGEA